jgi:hypothetical protein
VEVFDGRDAAVERSGGDGIVSSAMAAAMSEAPGRESSARARVGTARATRIAKATIRALGLPWCRTGRVKRFPLPQANRVQITHEVSTHFAN